MAPLCLQTNAQVWRQLLLLYVALLIPYYTRAHVHGTRGTTTASIYSTYCRNVSHCNERDKRVQTKERERRGEESLRQLVGQMAKASARGRKHCRVRNSAFGYTQKLRKIRIIHTKRGNTPLLNVNIHRVITSLGRKEFCITTRGLVRCRLLAALSASRCRLAAAT